VSGLPGRRTEKGKGRRGMKQKPVIFDVDGVLADFSVAFTALASAMFPGFEITRATDQATYHWQGLDKKQVNEVWRAIDVIPGFWESLPPLVDEYTFAQLHELTLSRPVYFVTARPDRAKAETEWWLEGQGAHRATVITTKRKGEFAKAVGAGFCIEDKPSNASMVAWLTDGETKSYLLDRPYNRVSTELLASDVTRIYTVNEYLEAINE
jgi:uncharacterized HAD superfamily protein